MIARESLAMGNWVTDENGMPFFIDGLFTDEVYLNFEGNEADVWEVPYKDLQPIPLTEKILKRMGFEEAEHYSFIEKISGSKRWNRHLWGDRSVSVRKGKEGEWFAVVYSAGVPTSSLSSVSSMHSLQNFVFLASGIQLAGEDFNDNEVFKD